METFNVKYEHGHFIDKENKKRIIPIQGKEYIIIGETKSFTAEDIRLEIGQSKNEDEKCEWMNGVHGKTDYGKILNAGEQLYFRIGNSKKIKGDEDREYIFRCTLNEDLYIYKLKNRNGIAAEDWRLADCNCELDKCEHGGLILTEKIAAESLNKLFNKTAIFYFSLQNSGSTNVFYNFYKYEKDTHGKETRSITFLHNFRVRQVSAYEIKQT